MKVVEHDSRSQLAQSNALKAPAIVDTARLRLRRPTLGDAPEIFRRYASDVDVTRFVGCPRHTSVDQTEAFVAFSDAEWDRWPAGAYLACSRDTGALVGSTGFGFESESRAATGYVFAKDAWGHGYATEALLAMVDLAPRLGVTRLFALCHRDHPSSIHVLEKGGFAREGVISRHAAFPNLEPGASRDAFCFVRQFDPATKPSREDVAR